MISNGRLNFVISLKKKKKFPLSQVQKGKRPSIGLWNGITEQNKKNSRSPFPSHRQNAFFY